MRTGRHMLYQNSVQHQDVQGVMYPTAMGGIDC